MLGGTVNDEGEQSAMRGNAQMALLREEPVVICKMEGLSHFIFSRNYFRVLIWAART